MIQAASSANQNDDIYTFVAATIAKELESRRPTPRPDSRPLRAIVGIESIKVLRIICKVEQRYDVELEDDTVFRANTIQDIVDAIRNATTRAGK